MIFTTASTSATSDSTNTSVNSSNKNGQKDTENDSLPDRIDVADQHRENNIHEHHHQHYRLSPYLLVENFFISIAMAIWIPFTLYLFIFSYALTLVHSICRRFPILYSTAVTYLRRGSILSLNAIRISVRSTIQVSQRAVDLWNNHLRSRLHSMIRNFSWGSFSPSSSSSPSRPYYTSNNGATSDFESYFFSSNSDEETSSQQHFSHSNNRQGSSILNDFGSSTSSSISPRSRQTTSDSTTYIYSSQFLTPQNQPSPPDSPLRNYIWSRNPEEDPMDIQAYGKSAISDGEETVVEPLD